MYDLEAFRKRVHELCRRSTPYEGERHATQRDLADAIGLHPTELSKRLNGAKDARLTERDVRAMVRTFVEWGAIQTQADALALLTLVEVAPFSAAEWQAPPLDSLTPLKSSSTTIATSGGQREAARSNLPQPLTSFIGRQREIAEITQLLSETRLVTVAGVGGIGKTRLAIEVAAQLQPAFPDSIWLVELAALTDPQLIPQATFTALGMRESATASLLDTLSATIGDKEMLLVLDNCEHLLHGVAEFAYQLLLRCSRLRLLATSREPLHIEGEAVWRLTPLALPQPDANPSPRSLMQYEAISLFVERAKSAEPAITLSLGKMEVVREICVRLDGIPLALELAAVMVRVMAVEQICQHLDDRFDLLTAGNRTALPRQQTLRALIDWSYDLLTPAERQLLARLAVFAGSFWAEDAEAICSQDGFTPQNLQSHEMRAGLQQLVEKSLLVKEERADIVSYRLLETIRSYAGEKLVASGEDAALRRMHAECYLNLAEQAEMGLRGAEQGAWLARLEQENDNLRAALGWLLAGGEFELAARLSSALLRFWFAHCHFSEARRWLDAVLAKRETLSAPIKAKVLNVAGIISYEQGDYEPAIELFEHSLSLRRQLGSPLEVASSLNNLALIAMFQGDYAQARVLQEECLSLRRANDDRWGAAISLSNLGKITNAQGDYTQATELIKESLTIRRELGDQIGLASGLNGLAEIETQHRDFEQAVADYTESILVYKALDDRLGMVEGLEGLAGLAAMTGQLTRAAQLLGAAEMIRQSLGAQMDPRSLLNYQQLVADTSTQLGEVAFTANWVKGRAMSLAQALAYALE